MRGMRPAGRRVDEQFRVPVVRGNQHASAALLDRLVNASQLRIHRLHRPHRRLHFARVPHHIRVRKVHDNHVKRRIPQRLDHRIPNPFRGHLRCEIVRRHLLRRHQLPILAPKRLLDAAVEEVRHMRVLFRLRHAQVAQVRHRHHVRQQVVHRLRRDHDRQLVGLVVLGHAHVVDSRRQRLRRNCVIQLRRLRQIAPATSSKPAPQPRRPCQHPRNLPRPVCPVVEAHHRILIPDQPRRIHRKRRHKLIRCPVRVQLLHPRRRVRIHPALGRSRHHRVERLLRLLPPQISIHRVVTPRNRRQSSHAYRRETAAAAPPGSPARRSASYPAHP